MRRGAPPPDIAAKGIMVKVRHLIAGLQSVAILLVGLPGVPAQAAPAGVPVDGWVANGTVWASARFGDTLYLGGTFSELSPPTGSSLRLDAATGVPTAGWPRAAGQVRAVAPLGGGWYLGGSFTGVGGVRRGGLAFVGENGAVTSWNPKAAGGSVRAMALSPDGSRLYVGGTFTKVKGAARAGLAAFATATGKLLPWAPAVAGGPVEAISVAPGGGTVVVGGGFGRVDGQTRSRLAAIDASGGGLTAWNPGTDGTVLALIAGADAVHVGGTFTTLAGAPRAMVGAVDPTTGDALPWASGADAPVRALTRVGDGLVVGGDFTSLGSQPRGRLGAVDAVGGGLRAWNPGANAPVHSLTATATSVLAGGNFTSIGGVGARRLASIDPDTGAVDPAWAPNPNATVLTIAASGASVVAAGAFTGAGGVLRTRLAAIDVATGVPTAWNPGANNAVHALATSPDGATVYAGGTFSSIAGLSRSRLAAIDAATGAGMAGFRFGANRRVRALAIRDDLLYVGGDFTTVAGQPRASLAAIRTSSGTLDTTWDPGAVGAVRTFAISNDGATVYAGGEFSSIGGVDRSHLAALDAATGVVQSGFLPSRAGYPTYRTFQLATDGSRVFAAMGGPGGGRLRAYDATTGEPRWEALADGDVQATAYANGRVVVGGHFDALLGSKRRSLGAVDAVTGALDPWGPATNGSIWHLAADAALVLAAGDFTTFGGTIVRGGVAVFPDV